MAQPPTTGFLPLFGIKSDGLDVINQKGKILRNGPTQDQLDKTPNDQGQCDFYRLIEKDDPKHVDWRKKLGGMLLRQVGGKAEEDKIQQCLLWDLPANYVLYEHIKTKADGQVKTVKNHSGGGHDRQDAYLYGYPKGPKKRFRSPVEFFPHLLWLCTDETSDYNNCTCKMCSPTQPEQEKPAVKAEVKTEPKSEAVAAARVGPAMSAQIPSQVVGRNPVVQIATRRSSTGAPAQSPDTKPAAPVTNSSTPVPAPTSSIKPPSIIESSQLPQPRSLDHQIDLSYGVFLCRPGEVVWFARDSASWGLGLVVRRWKDKCYLVQPLSHPFDDTTKLELITKDQSIKPWLAWSPPACTYTYLQQHPHLTYGQVDWRALESGQFGTGYANVDASILAAKALDSTYTLFEPLRSSVDGNVQVRSYNGIYLGAEKVWCGDPVRLRIGSGTDLMVITDIVQRVFTNAPQNQPNAPPATQIIVIGDIYCYSTLAVSDPPNLPKIPQHNQNIPSRMVQDVVWRNNMLVPSMRTLGWWKLIAAGSKLDIGDIKGRWYETSILFQDPFQQAVKNNEGGNGIWMNSRGDATGMGKNAGHPVEDRVAAFGQSIPKGTGITIGLDPPDQSAQPQHTQSHDMEGLSVGVGAGNTETFSIDDFMNVDHLEDTGMGFQF